jgi:hypothetical protein
MLVAGELMLDLVTTIISFIALFETFSCCGEPIEMRGMPLGITIPFFLLILVELFMLVRSVRHHLYGTTSHQSAASSAGGMFAFLGSTVSERWVNGLLILNPFFGFMMAWMLLYQSNKKESLAVLGLEAGSLLLHYLSVYFEGNKQTWVSMAIYSLPLIPFAVTVVVILVYLDMGGVCYLVEDSLFWYKGCQVCDDDSLPVDGLCTDGTGGEFGTYCSATGDDSFCFFYY